jgi:hypothetical protein
LDVEGPERVFPQKTPVAQTTGVSYSCLGLLILPEGLTAGNVDREESDDITNADELGLNLERTTGNDADSHWRS